MRNLVLALSALTLMAGATTPTLAANCRDKSGKFVKCPTAKPKQCRDAKGHFTKCK